MENQAQAPIKKSSLSLTLLSFTVIILVCVVGYDILKVNWSPSVYAEKKVKTKKPLRIVSDNGDPQRTAAKRQKAYSSYTANNSETLGNQFQNTTIRTLEKELELAHRKIESFDFTLDTLTNKIEVVRAEKNRLEEQYSNQITQIEQQNLSDKEELNRSLQESFAAQAALKKTIEDKIAKIDELNLLLTTQKESIESQTKEMQAINEKLRSAYAATDNERAQNIFLRGELFKTRQSALEVNEDLAEFEAELDDAIKSEIQLKEMVNHLNTMVTIKDFEINAITESYAKSKIELEGDVQDLVFLINVEKNKARTLREQLQNSVENYATEKQNLALAMKKIEVLSLASQEEIQALMLNNSETLQKVASLTELFEIERKDLEATLVSLSQQRDRAESLQEQLNAANTQLNHKESDFAEKMLTMKLALGVEKIHVEDLSENLKLVSATYEEERSKALDLQSVLVAAIENSLQLEAELFKQRSLLAAQEMELELEREAADQAIYQTEEAYKYLKEEQMLVSQKQEQIANLETSIDSEKQKIRFIEEQLSTQFSRMTQKEQEYEGAIKELTENLQDQKTRTLDLYVLLEETLTKYAAESDQVAELERQLSEKVNSFESELAELRTLFAKKEEDLQLSTSKEIQELENKLQENSEALLKEKAELSKAESKATFLEQELIDQLTAMAEKEQQMQLAIVIGEERSKELENQLSAARQTQEEFAAKVQEKTITLKEIEQSLAETEEKNSKLLNDLALQTTLVAQMELNLKAAESNWLVQQSEENERSNQLIQQLAELRQQTEALALELTGKNQEEESIRQHEKEMMHVLHQAYAKQEELEEQLSISIARTQITENQLLELKDLIQINENERLAYQKKIDEAATFEKERMENELLTLEADLSLQRLQELEQTALIASLRESNVELEEKFNNEKAQFLNQLAMFEEQQRSSIEALQVEQNRGFELTEQIAALKATARDVEKKLEEQRAQETEWQNQFYAASAQINIEKQKALELEAALRMEQEEKARAIAFEQERTVLLEKELEQHKFAMASLTQDQQTAKHCVAELENKIAALKEENLFAKDRNADYATKFQDLEERCSIATVKAQILSEDLSVEQTKSLELQLALDKTKEIVNAIEGELAESRLVAAKLPELEVKLLNTTHQLATLEHALQESVDVANNIKAELAAQAQALEAEQKRSSGLELALNDSSDVANNIRAELAAKVQTLEAEQKRSSGLELALNDSFDVANNIRAELAAKTQTLEAEQKRSSGLELALNESADLANNIKAELVAQAQALEAEQKRSSDLELALNESTDLANNIKAELVAQAQALEAEQKRSSGLELALNESADLANNIRAELAAQAQALEAEQKRSSGLELALNDSFDVANNIRAELAAQAQALEAEQKRSSGLELALNESADLANNIKAELVAQAQALEAEQKRSSGLELALNDSVDVANNIRAELAAQAQALEAEQKRSSGLEIALNDSFDVANNFKAELVAQVQALEAEQKRSSDLELALNESADLANNFKAELVAQAQAFEAEQKRSSDLELALNESADLANNFKAELVAKTQTLEAEQKRSSQLEIALNDSFDVANNIKTELAAQAQTLEARLLLEQKKSSELELALQNTRLFAEQLEGEYRLAALTKEELEERTSIALAKAQILEIDLEEQGRELTLQQVKAIELEAALQCSMNELTEKRRLADSAKELEEQCSQLSAKVHTLESDLEEKQLLINIKDIALKESSDLEDELNRLRPVAALANELEKKYLAITSHVHSLEGELSLAMEKVNASEIQLTEQQLLKNQVAELLAYVAAIETKDQEIAARYSLEIEQLKSELFEEKAYAKTLHDTLNESMVKFDAEERNLFEKSNEVQRKLVEQEAAIARREKEMQSMLDQYTLTNGDLLAQISEIRLVLDQEKALKNELLVKIQGETPANSEEEKISALE